MSLPKSKMISASKALLALAAKGKYQRDESVRAIQNQNVNITVQHNPNLNNCTTPATVITNTKPRTHDEPSTFDESTADIPVVERDVKLDLEPNRDTTLEQINEPNIGTTFGTTLEQINDVPKDYYEELDNLHAIVNNYETVAKALLLIIELLQSNPLKLNKIIIPTEPAFKELIIVLTGADDVEIRYSEDIACGISSKKYRVIEDIIVIKHQDPKSLKYSYPDVIRLFDKFNISVKLISKRITT